MPNGPAALPPGEGIGPAVAPQSYLLRREQPELAYRGLVDPVNERLIVKRLRFADAATLADDLLRAARAHEVGKVLLYAGAGQWRELLARGFVLEGVLDGFFTGEPAFLMGYVLEGDRWAAWDMEREDAVLEAALAAAPASPVPLAPECTLVPCGPEAAAELAAVYQATFTTYPAPLHDPAFVRRLITSGDGIFRAVRQDGRIASVAAAEVDREYGAAELTNCATLPAFRGGGLIQHLLVALEQELDRQALPVRFSLARATSFGMNRALHKAGFGYRGRLRCNSQIMGRHENMNLWVKQGAGRLFS